MNAVVALGLLLAIGAAPPLQAETYWHPLEPGIDRARFDADGNSSRDGIITVVRIDPERWEVRDGRLFLNANLLAEVLWEIDRDGNARAADAHWADYPRGVIPAEDAPAGSAAGSPSPGTPGDARGRGADLSLSHQG